MDFSTIDIKQNSLLLLLPTAWWHVVHQLYYGMRNVSDFTHNNEVKNNVFCLNGAQIFSTLTMN